jgi:sulfide:quinone oxidoreductase
VTTEQRDTSGKPSPYPRLVIAGGGPAAVEALLAVRDEAGEQVEIELIAPQDEFVYRPAAVAEPFGLERPARFAFARVAELAGARFRRDRLESVDVEGQRAHLGSGEPVAYDALLLAVGAQAHASVPGAITFWGAGGDHDFRAALDRLRRDGGELVFVVPHRMRWSLPLYELALLAAEELREAGAAVRVRFLTPEAEPLAIFGGRVSEELLAMLAGAGIEFEPSVDPTRPVHRGEDQIDVVALPRLTGPGIDGVPADDLGFLPIDAFGRVLGAPGLYAAGDATDYHVKQGGLATEQADAAAGAICADLGFDVEPEPFEPVLRGRVYARGPALFMRRELEDAHAIEPEFDSAPLWWPGSKLFGKHLSPFLASIAGEAEAGARR